MTVQQRWAVLGDASGGMWWEGIGACATPIIFTAQVQVLVHRGVIAGDCYGQDEEGCVWLGTGKGLSARVCFDPVWIDK